MDGPAPDNLSPAERKRRVSAVLAEVSLRRSRGEVIADAEVIAAHPDLMPELQRELEALQSIHRAFLAARQAGPAGPAGPAAPAAPAPEKAVETPPNCPAELRILGYAIEQEISAGGQGTVFRAIQESTGRVVAVKVIPGGPFLSSRHRSRFEREVDILAQLDHPNIVGVLDRGRTADGSLFLVMKFIDGCTLDEYLDRRRMEGDLSSEEVVVLFAQIAQAVEEAHQRGIVHRDLKPHNIRIDQRGRPHVLDFGLARLTDPTVDESRFFPVTLTGQIVGSLPWASPEQIAGDPEKVSYSSDAYSIGVMLYQALTGQFPYTVMGAMRDVMDNIAKAIPVRPSERKSKGMTLEPALDAIVLKALAKRPEDRYASAGELAQDLEAYLAGHAPVKLPPRVRGQWLKRAGVATLGLVLCLGAVWYRGGFPAAPPTPLALPAWTNSIGMKFVRLPAGRFTMGSSMKEDGRNTDERTHIVELSRAFYLGCTEVTQAQYRAVMNELPVRQEWVGDNLPVAYITWDEAMAFCRRLSEKEGHKYRLPTEAEWEYACRATSAMPFSGVRDVGQIGWYEKNGKDQLHPVAGKPPNYWGLYDMHGNVAEWCLDGYSSSAPPDHSVDPQGPQGDASRIVRGGSVLQSADACRSARRGFHLRSTQQTDLGFRVLLEAGPNLP